MSGHSKGFLEYWPILVGNCPMTDIAALLAYLNNQNLCLLADHLLHSHDLYDTASSVIVMRNWLFPTLYNGQLTLSTTLLMRPLFCCPKKVIHLFKSKRFFFDEMLPSGVIICYFL